MPEIQYFPQTLLFFILFHNTSFYIKGTLYYCFDVFIDIFFFKYPEQFGIRRKGHLHCLRKTVRYLPLRQCFQDIGIYQNFFRLIKRAHDIFYSIQIHGCLAAYGRIHLGKHCRRYIIEIHTAHVTCGGESRQIAHDAASDGNDTILSRKACPQHFYKKLFKNLYALAVLPGLNCADVRIRTLLCYSFAILWRNAVVGDYQNLTF